MGKVTSCSTHIVMLIALVGSSVCSPARGAGDPEHMTYTQAKARIVQRPLPDFWIGDIRGLAARFEGLTKGAVSVVAIAPSGRPMHLVTYGEREPVERRANFNSAIE